MAIQGNLKTPDGQTLIPNTSTNAIADIERERSLAYSLGQLVERNALGYPAFTTTNAYAAGDVVFYDRKLWKFTSAHTANTSWDANEVTECSIRDLLPADVMRSSSDATFVNANNEALFYMRQADEHLAGLMTSAEHNKLAALPTDADLGTGIIYDVSALHPTSGVSGGSTYASLSAALAVIPQAKRKGGMSVKFVLSSDNKYVEYFLTKDEWSVSEADWEKINLEKGVKRLQDKFASTSVKTKTFSATGQLIVYYTDLNIKQGDTFKVKADAVGSTSWTSLYILDATSWSGNQRAKLTNGVETEITAENDISILSLLLHNSSVGTLGDISLTLKLNGKIVTKDIDPASLDDTPTESSDKLVKSGGVYAFVEKASNKVTSWETTPSDTKYPSEKLVKDTIDPISGNVENSKQVLDTISARTINLFNKEFGFGEEKNFLGYYSSGNWESNNGYLTTHPIAVDEGNSYATHIFGGIITRIRFTYYYNSSKNLISTDSTINDTGLLTIPSGQNIAYVRLCFAHPNVIDYIDDLIVVHSSTVPTEHIPYYSISDDVSEYLIKEQESTIKGLLSVQNGSWKSGATLSQNQTLELPMNHVRRGVVKTVKIKGAISSVYLGSNGSYLYRRLELTPTEIIVKYYYGGEWNTSKTITHGLTLGNDTSITVAQRFNNETKSEYADIILMSNGIQAKFDGGSWDDGGAAYVTNNGIADIDVELSCKPDTDKDVWVFGDSYLSNAATRWPYYMFQWGFTDWMQNNFPGQASTGEQNAIDDFDNLMALGKKPKYLVWALGMNDGSDGDSSPSSTWLTAVEHVIDVCNKNGITPILVTIPNTPTLFHTRKRNWILASGYRYIDESKAVGATTYRSGENTWYGAGTDYDYKESSLNGVHPSALGAAAIATQILLDFPEIVKK